MQKLKWFIYIITVLSYSYFPNNLYSTNTQTKSSNNTKQNSITKQYNITNQYVHQWINFPKIKALNLSTLQNSTVIHKKGQILVVFFISSWCVPCQRLMDRFIEIDNKFSKLYTKIIYILTHDTQEDALGFAKEFKIINKSLLYNDDIIQTFHNPQLPSVYISDKEGWLINRYIKINYENTLELEKFLDMLNSF